MYFLIFVSELLFQPLVTFVCRTQTKWCHSSKNVIRNTLNYLVFANYTEGTFISFYAKNRDHFVIDKCCICKSLTIALSAYLHCHTNYHTLLENQYKKL